MQTPSVGGMVGYFQNSTATNCYNLGFQNDPSRTILDVQINTGGLIGYSNHSSIVGCGVENGVVIGNDSTGGVVGSLLDTSVDQVYVNKVTVLSNTSNVGNLFGLINVDSFSSISNVYARGNTSGDSIIVTETKIIQSSHYFSFSINLYRVALQDKSILFPTPPRSTFQQVIVPAF